jgi:superoxide dismutase
MDYGARAAGYLDAFSAAINWRFADGLYARASA